MALFGKKSPPSDQAGAGGNEDPGFSPVKAEKFFQHARSMHEATNYEYALQLWLRGLRFDPTNMEAMAGFFKSAEQFLGTPEGAKGPSKDTQRVFNGGTPLEKYLLALLKWGCNPSDASLGVKATDLAASLGLEKPALWLGEHALNKARGEKKPRKDQFTTLMEAFKKFGAYELAVQAGEDATRVDPADNKLISEVRNMAAQATMTKGGFEDVGKEGGFRSNIRDAARQQQLEEEGRVVKTEGTLDRLIEAAKAEYEARPTDKPSIKKYAERLMERGRPEDEETAFVLMMKAYEQTQEFRFRQVAGDIRLRQGRRQLAALQKSAEAGGEAEKQKYERAKKRLTEIEIEEYTLRVAAYPTDLSLKFELGRRYFEVGQYDKAVEYFQEARNEGKNRLKALLYLGMSFQNMGWHDESIETFRMALESLDGQAAEVVREVRYGLLKSLEARAEERSDIGDAEEAYKLASSIAIEQINFKDIRARRESIKQIVMRLKSGGGE